MISVAIIIERTEIRLGGAERSIAELTDELNTQGIRAKILAASGMSTENVTVLCSSQPTQRISLPAFEKALISHLAENHYDIVHSVLPFSFADIYQPRGGSYKEAMLQNAASCANPVIARWKLWTHLLNFRRTAYLRAEQALCSPTQHTIVAALSDYVKQQFIRHCHLPEQRIAVIPNGINLNRLTAHPNGDAFRQSVCANTALKKILNPVLFLLAANNFRLKGLRQAIQSIQIGLKENPKSPAVLVVAGSDNPAPYQTLAKTLGIENRILFLGSQSNLADALAGCDAAILPTWYDPCSRFILEAIAADKPIITTQFNGAAERYQDGKHGFIVKKPSCTAKLADAINSLCSPATRQSCIDAIRRDNLKDQISITRHVGQLRQVYDIILTRKKG
jgi:glycosyltransferase involved in cell wall biosynthesis